MSAVRGYATASHLAPTLVVTTLATAMAVGFGARPTQTVTVAVAVLLGQLSVGWSNDWLDAERDRVVQRSAKPVVEGVVTPDALCRAAWVALVGCALASWATGPVPGTVHMVAVASAWAYNVGLKVTLASWVPYAISFGLLAAFAPLAAGAQVVPWLIVAAALLGCGAHIANALPDLEDDQATGVHGLPQRLGRRVDGVLSPILLAGAVVVVILAPPGMPSEAALAIGGLALVTAVIAGLLGAGALGTVRSRAPFGLSMAVAGLCVGLLILAPSGAGLPAH